MKKTAKKKKEVEYRSARFTTAQKTKEIISSVRNMRAMWPKIQKNGNNNNVIDQFLCDFREKQKITAYTGSQINFGG